MHCADVVHAVLLAALIDLDAPPSAMTATTAHLSDVLKSHDAAVGHRPAGAPDNSIEDWTFVGDGQHGTEHVQRAGTDYASQITRGPFTESYGQFDGARWHRDYNGFTSTTFSEEYETFLPLRVLALLEDPKNDVSLKGETTDPSAEYVIEVKRPQHRHPDWVFVDKATYLIDRVEIASGKRRLVSTYSDYRSTDGLREPWHIHDADGRAQLDYDWQRTRLSHPATMSFSLFAPPASAPTIALGFAADTALPVKMYYGQFIVRLSVQGRGLDFLIDSASATSYIDRDVAQELSLPTYDALTQLNDGTPLDYMTRLDAATVGPLLFRNFVLESTQYDYQVSDETKVVGVLGYDFLAGVVLHMNYQDGTAELIPRDRFAGATPVAGAYQIPIVMDDGRPMVPMGIGEDVSQRAVLDTAMPFTIVTGPYIDKHGSDFTDLPHQDHKSAIVPFADDSSYGTAASVWLTQVSHLRFGPADYQKYIVVATNFPFGGSDDDADAIVGIPYLAFFDVYLDYANQRVLLKPNASFFKIFHPAK
ncbi:MAG: aspartyl protease family protein [Candidatus Aquilonibacter sp.]